MFLLHLIEKNDTDSDFRTSTDSATVEVCHQPNHTVNKEGNRISRVNINQQRSVNVRRQSIEHGRGRLTTHLP